MAYFMIGSTDLSSYTSKLSVKYVHSYSSQTNAIGDTLVDYITRKRQVEVEIIALDDSTVKTILDTINDFAVSI